MDKGSGTGFQGLGLQDLDNGCQVRGFASSLQPRLDDLAEITSLKQRRLGVFIVPKWGMYRTFV